MKNIVMNDESKKLLEYYSRSLFYSDIPYKNKGEKLFKVSLEEDYHLKREQLREVWEKFSNEEEENTNIKQERDILIAPCNFKRNGEDIRPFWFPARISNSGELLPPSKRNTRIFVPRMFLSPYLDESYQDIQFCGVKEYENNCNLKDLCQPFEDYFKKIKGAYKSMTDNELPSSQQWVIYGGPVKNDYSKRIRDVYNKLSISEEIPNLLTSLLDAKEKQECVTAINVCPKTEDEKIALIKAGQNHLGQMISERTLSPSQRKALFTWLKNEEKDIFAISGPAGTGKTTLIQSFVASKMVESVQNEKPYLILCCATSKQAGSNIIDSFGNFKEEEICLDKNNSVPSLATSYGYKNEDYLHINPSSDEGGAQLHTLLQFPKKKDPGVYEYFRNKNGITNEETYKTEIEKYCEAIQKGSEELIKCIENVKDNEFKTWLDETNTIFPEAKIQEKQDYYVTDVTKFEDLLDITYRYKAFYLAVKYWRVKWLNSLKTDIIERKDSIRNIAMLTPCIVSTFHSVPRLMNGLYSEADYLIIDEAGQTLPEVGVAAFAFAQKALVFGDEKQLEPIWSMTKPIDMSNLALSKLKLKFNDLEKRKMLSSSGNMMGFAKTACEIGESSQPGVMLTEHRRCRKEIIDYCNRLVYNNQLICESSKRDEQIEEQPPFVFINVDGESEQENDSNSRYNKNEVTAIVKWIKDNRSTIQGRYPDKHIEELIAIVTPFKAQAKLLIEKLNEEGLFANSKTLNKAQEDRKENLPDKPMVVGTVHELQGAEAPIVIFSSVYGKENIDAKKSKLPFIDSKPNMLNVAVSRAKDQFIVFGNAMLYHKSVFRYYSELFEQKKNITVPPSALLKVYCNRHNSDTPYFFDGMVDVVEKRLNEGNKTNSDAEKLFLDLIVPSLKNQEYEIKNNITIQKYCEENNISDTIFKPYQIKFIGANKKKAWAHFDFTIDNNHRTVIIEIDGSDHNKSKQKNRDAKKDSVVKDMSEDGKKIVLKRVRTDESISQSELLDLIKNEMEN